MQRIGGIGVVAFVVLAVVGAAAGGQSTGAQSPRPLATCFWDLAGALHHPGGL